MPFPNHSMSFHDKEICMSCHMWIIFSNFKIFCILNDCLFAGDSQFFPHSVIAEPVTCKTGIKDTVAEILGSFDIQGATLKVTRGDYSPILKRLIRRLESAKVILKRVA